MSVGNHVINSTSIGNRKDKRLIMSKWKHKITGLEYIDSLSQTGPSMKFYKKDNMFSREAQTVYIEEASTDMTRNRAMQMFRKDCNISNESDQYLPIGNYETYVEMLNRLDFDGKARIIQKNYRIYRLRRRIKESARIYREILEERRRMEEEKRMEERKKEEELLIRMTYPRNRKDFQLLYDEVDKWRRERFELAKATECKIAQCKENYATLMETLKRFLNIERLKQVAKIVRNDKDFYEFLDIYSEPLRWFGYKGLLIEVVNLKTQRARKIKSKFDTINKKDLSVEERVEALMTFKKFLELHNCLDAFELIGLIDQEMMLLSRGIDCLELDCLRKRIARGFLKFISDSDVCASGDHIVSCQCFSGEWLKPIEPRTLLCRSCQRILPFHHFANYDRRRALTSYCDCKVNRTACRYLKNGDIRCMNYEKYEHLLSRLRSEERSRNCFSGLAHVLHASDIYHLVNVIWHGCSVLSKHENIFNLRLVRFRPNETWTPWNCVLLTEREAIAHLQGDVQYPKHVIRQIILCHGIAKSHYSHFNVYLNFKPDKIQSSFSASSSRRSSSSLISSQ
ncbi:IQ motif and ubiquitin-like domain-containing protein [Prorops nasuta]|uniref:IQ motif and ubiquitin-like domain-containing protein n=1 Tax=Prorops nasuta TaxID=863751 RepID=UPI0034CDF0EB